MVIKDSDAREEVLSLVRITLAEHEDRLRTLVNRRKRGNAESYYGDPDRCQRDFEESMGRWQQIVTYAEKKL